MASTDGQATFRINIDGNAADASKDVSAAARQAAKSIGDYESEVKALSADLRRLRGNSEEVVAAKTALKKRITESKDSISKLTTEIAKQGTTYTAAAAAAKKYGDGVGRLPNLRSGLSKGSTALGKMLDPTAKKLGKALDPASKKLGELLDPLAKKLGPKLAPAAKKLGAFGAGAKSVAKAVKQDAASVLPSLGSMLGVVASGAALAAAAVVAVGAAAVAGAAAVVAFGIASANAAAKVQRQREALLGNANDAKALGEQVTALAGKVPQGAAELDELALSLSKTRLSGKAMVSTMNAVAQAAGAVDAAAGAKLQELVTRGQHTGRFSLGRRELDGTGIDFDDVAKAYAEGTRKSLAAARAELAWGKVSLEDGAEALKKATERKFGDINLKNAFSLDNAPKKFADQLRVLTSGVDLGPITKGLQDAFGQLAPEAPLGAAIKTFMETVGTGFVDIAGKSIPVFVEGVKWLLVWALKLGTAYYETKKQVQDAFAEGNWVGVGKAIVTGLLKGLSLSPLTAGVIALADKIKSTFKGEMEIHSPSKVFQRYGQNTTEGYVEGVERGSRRASGAVADMVQMPSPAARGGGGDGPIHVVLQFNNVPTGDAQAIASTLQSGDVLAALVRAIRDARTARGIGPVTVSLPGVAA